MAARRNARVFDKPRWLVVTGDGPLERIAAADAGALIQRHVPYVLQTHVGGCDRRRLRDHSLLLVGTRQSNPLIGKLMDEGAVPEPVKEQSCVIRTLPSPYHPERQVVVLAGADARGVLYAARDWEHDCVDPYVTSLQRRFRPAPHLSRRGPQAFPFHAPVPEWERAGAPAVAARGIWTWGHVVYDYRAFFEHMSRWKMNTFICWNDAAPVNADEVVAAAHRLGIDVIWGTTWCWGEEVDPRKPAELTRWRDQILRTYDEQYAPLRGDGLYFQTFTETNRLKIGRRTIAELAAEWVNDIAGALLERHPGLTVQFGVHATSIRENLGHLAAVDPRVDLVWEDAGGFPFTYDVTDVSSLDETVAYTRRLTGLRGRKAEAGLVLKGMTSLYWRVFEHPLGPFVMGRADRDFIRRRAAEVAPRWKQVEVGWRRHLGAVCRTVRAALSGRPGRLTVTGLVEDGMWEERMWLPPCLLAEVLWDPRERPESIVARVSATRDAACLA
jgi:hypothetical protein